MAQEKDNDGSEKEPADFFQILQEQQNTFPIFIEGQNELDFPIIMHERATRFRVNALFDYPQ